MSDFSAAADRFLARLIGDRHPHDWDHDAPSTGIDLLDDLTDGLVAAPSARMQRWAQKEVTGATVRAERAAALELRRQALDQALVNVGATMTWAQATFYPDND